ncbi:MAG: dethiobiotin synthase [Chromatiaceae bacterium]|nr:dethiobiotin synthase [Chromatiaceae bacterium]MBP6733995.1 dethiobiotin synthase [Chromatiaceae bacterium]MBP6807549.1 dethiobiotin synthase [Chromatiaceae bacterium]MBP8288683.1 dethiobiotin synthase [Chromatiaceae bacterium]MBP9602659.1 dethiobiotin synthase [Chromatiaceae bacterium]
MKGLFVTGTDTACGKTEVSLGLVQVLRQRGLKVQGMKPVASGCEAGPRGLRNADAQRLRAQSSRLVPYAWVNPYAFSPPIAPHIAAREAGVEISLDLIRERADTLAAQADCLIVEGVGGWRVPLGPDLAVSDLPRALGLPVILVVGLRLGGINHALLTAESILARGCHLVGWVANQIDPGLARREENLAALSSLIRAPCIGFIPWLVASTAEGLPEALASHLAIDKVWP